MHKSRINKLMTISFTIASYGHSLFGSCPAANEGFSGGCVTVEENHIQPNGKKLELFYQVWGTFDQNKKTIIFINGGPGNDNSTHSGAQAYHNLADQFNILFYDQRGLAKSGKLTSESFNTLDRANYLTNSNVEDLAQIIDQVAGGKAIIFGHSYGGGLAYSFAQKYSNKLYSAIIMSGISDYSFTHASNIADSNYQNTLFSQFDTQRVNALFQLIQEGRAGYFQPGDIDWNHFLSFFMYYQGTYEGQYTLFPNFLKVMLAKNASLIDTLLAETTTDRILTDENIYIKTPHVLGEEEDMGLNWHYYYNIMCHEIYNKYFPEIYRQENTDILNTCKTIIREDLETPFNLKKDFNKITVPVLVIGGSHDINVPLSTQQEDYDALIKVKNDVHFVTLDKTGHMAFEDSPKCLEKSIRDFASLALIAENKAWTCIESETIAQ